MPQESVREKQKRAIEIYKRLDHAYPDVTTFLTHTTPFQLLVAVILSAQCTDERVNMVTPALFEKYPTPAAMAAADIEEIKKIIKSINFFNTKALNIKKTAAIIQQEYQGNVPAKLKELILLPGVGRKTANVVLGQSFGIPGITVDTHVKRVSNRLDFTRHQDPVKIERDLMAIWTEETWSYYSNVLIVHGRRICTAAKPKCGECIINTLCPKRGVIQAKPSLPLAKKIVSASFDSKCFWPSQISYEKRIPGGSSAQTWICRDTKTAELFVRKQSCSPESNGIPHLKHEFAWIHFLQTHENLIYRELGHYFPSVRKCGEFVNNSNDYWYYEMDYINGKALPEVFGVQSGMELSVYDKLALSEKLFQVLVNGYFVECKILEKEEGEQEFKTYYIQRLNDRLPLLRAKNHLLKLNGLERRINTIFDLETIKINGRQYQNPLRILADMERKYIAFLRPVMVSLLVHADLNPGNIVLGSVGASGEQRLWLVDPHGQTSLDAPVYKDPMVDFGKFFFGIQGFSDIISAEPSGGFNFSMNVVSEDEAAFEFKLHEKRSNTAFAGDLMKHLETSPAMAPLRQKEPYWKYRIQFISALQFLADMIYRTDSKQVLANFLQATILFQTLMEELKNDNALRYLTRSV